MVGGTCGKGHAWQGACMVGDMCGGVGGIVEGMHGRSMCGGVGVCVAEGMHGRGACMAGGCAWQEGIHCRGMCVTGETVTAADSTNPTGMHSCSSTDNSDNIDISAKFVLQS